MSNHYPKAIEFAESRGGDLPAGSTAQESRKQYLEFMANFEIQAAQAHEQARLVSQVATMAGAMGDIAAVLGRIDERLARLEEIEEKLAQLDQTQTANAMGMGQAAGHLGVIADTVEKLEPAITLLSTCVAEGGSDLDFPKYLHTISVQVP